MTPISTAACRSYANVERRYSEITEKWLCIHQVDTPVGERGDACYGDSGGPVMCGGCGHRVLAGLVAWGPDDCSGDEPAVNTRVSEFRDWIKSHTGF